MKYFISKYRAAQIFPGQGKGHFFALKISNIFGTFEIEGIIGRGGTAVLVVFFLFVLNVLYAKKKTYKFA